MLTNIIPREQLRGLARLKSRQYLLKAVRERELDEALEAGWQIDRKLKSRVRVRRLKPRHQLLEDRVWTLMYRMGFGHLSGQGGAQITVGGTGPGAVQTQVDVVAVDGEVALAIECKSAASFTRRSRFPEDLGKHALVREHFARALRSQFEDGPKRPVVLAMALSNIGLSEGDRARAEKAKVAVLEDRDLAYYEELVAHLGPAAKYQLLADLLPGRPVTGLELRVPAIRAKMGGSYCYEFAISPEYLLKIAYVSHRAKGKPSDVDAYQRMLKKHRLNRIREYISDDGIFPTNIVVNLDPRRLRFDRIHQEGDDREDTDRGVLGWLTLTPAYKSAWIIDGQHRLFAYSGHPKAARSLLSVLAFSGLPHSKQAELFIDINARQKSVKRSLLQELYAELHWDAEDVREQLSAIIAKAILTLDGERDSPFYQRIQKADERKDSRRCITLTSLFQSLDGKPELHISKERGGHVVEFGPLWSVAGREATLKRTVQILKSWFDCIRAEAQDWWDKGSADGGGLAMNDGVVSCVAVLRSVLRHIAQEEEHLADLTNAELASRVGKYAVALGAYLGGLPEDERRRFRSYRGVEGQTKRTRQCQLAIRHAVTSFNPPGLDDFVQQERAQTNVRAKVIIDRIEGTLQEIVLSELRSVFTGDASSWWTVGVPRPIRQQASQAFEEDDRKREGPENYLTLLDYKKIAMHNWEQFQRLLADPNSGRGKERQTAWIEFVNEQRNIVAHASSGRTVSVENLARLEEYDAWLQEQESPTPGDYTEATNGNR